MTLKKDDIVYFSHVLPKLSIYEVLEVQVRTIGSDWFVAINTKNNNVYAFTEDDKGKKVFKTYEEAYENMNQQRESE